MTIVTPLQSCPCWGGGGMGGGGMGGWGTTGSGAWGLGFIPSSFWPLVIGVVVIGAVYLYSRRTDAPGSDGAMELLRERYARGEIGDEEFDERSSALSAGRSHSGPERHAP